MNTRQMTWDVWKRLPEIERAKHRDNSQLSPQLCGREGLRVEVVDQYGEKRQFWVGKSTGWKPIHLEIKTTRSLVGDAAAQEYQSVRVVRYR